LLQLSGIDHCDKSKPSESRVARVGFPPENCDMPVGWSLIKKPHTFARMIPAISLVGIARLSPNVGVAKNAVTDDN
jgi:hypothetical protein